MGLELALPWKKKQLEQRSDPALAFNDWVALLNQFTFQGLQYTLPGATQEEVGSDYVGLSRAAYKTGGVVFACMMVRQLLFSEARFQFRQLQSGRPGKLFGNQDLRILERPWPGGTTGDLLSKNIQHADLAGNAFTARRNNTLAMLRPDWVDIVVGSLTNPEVKAWDVDAQIIGYIYHPGGRYSGREQVNFLADEVSHFAPIPDPEAMFRGMSWITPVAREVMADKATTAHKLRQFENGATPNLIVKFETDNLEKFRVWIEEFREGHEGAENIGKTLFLASGMDATPVGLNFQELEFKATQAAGETRIAAAAGVPPVIAGFSEGLDSATYSNYAQARRRFADGTMRPLWRNMAGSLSRIIQVPGGAELWYDDRDIPFLAEDLKDAAVVMREQATAANLFFQAGYEPNSIRDAIDAGDLSLLTHTGLTSVQAQPGNNGSSNGTALKKPALAEAASESGWDMLLARIQGTEAPTYEIHNHVEPQDPPVVNLNVEAEKRAKVKTIDFGDGRKATVTEDG